VFWHRVDLFVVVMNILLDLILVFVLLEIDVSFLHDIERDQLISDNRLLENECSLDVD